MGRKREPLRERRCEQPYVQLYVPAFGEARVKTHFVEELSDRETVVKKVEIVPLEVIIRNLSAGSFAKRFEWRKASSSHSRPSSFPIRTTTLAIR